MPDPAIEVGIHARFAQVSGMDLISREVERASEKFKLNPRNFAELEKITKRAGKKYYDFVTKARPVGLSKEVEAISDRYQKLQRGLANDVIRVAHLEASIKASTNADERATLKAQLKAVKTQADERAALLEKELEAADEIASRRSEGLAKLNEAMNINKSEGVKSGINLAEGFAKGLSRLDPTDLGGLAEGLGAALSKGGGMLEGLGGARMAAGKGGGAALAGLGARLGGLAGPLAAVGAAVAAIVALFALADKQTKDFNKTLLQGAGAADFAISKVSGEMTDFTGALEDARKVAISQSWVWREQPDEIMKIVAAANEAGLTYKEMSERLDDTGDNVTVFTRLTQQALTYTRSLGVSTEEIAQTTAQWMHDFGGGLETIDHGFSSIYAAAMESGMGAKRFFGMVTQATAGLALYNVRIDETAALMSKLAESLGETGGSEFLQGLTKGFSAESYQDRFKRILITGQPMVARVLEANADDLMKTFGQRVREAGGKTQAGVEDAFKKVLPEADFATLMQGGPQAMAAIRKLSQADTRELVARVMEADTATGRQLQTLIGAVEGTSGKLGDQAKALDELGPGGVLAMQINSASGVLGARVSEMGAMQLAAFEQMTGYSGEQLHQLQRLDQALYGEWELLKDQGQDVGSFEEWLMNQGDRIADEIGEPMSVQEQLAKEMVKNTESITQVLQGRIAYLLESLNSVLSSFRDAYEGYSESDVKARDETIQEMEQQREALAAAIAQTRAGVESGAITDTSRLAAQEAALKALNDKIGHFRTMDLADYDPRSGISKTEIKRARDVTNWGGGTGWRTPTPTGMGPTDEELKQLTMSPSEYKDSLITALADEVKAPLEKGSEDAVKAQKEEFKKLEDKYPSLTMEGYLEALRRRDVEEAAGILATTNGELDPGMAARYMETLSSGGVLGPTLTAKLAAESLTLATRFGVRTRAMEHDFIYRGGAGGGVITPINRADQLLGGKAGGPVASAIGGGNVTININGGDTARIYEVVKRAMRESGVRPPPGGRKG